MSDQGEYEQLVEGLRTSAGMQDEIRVSQGEIALAIATSYGTLQQAAIDAHIEYKTLHEYKSVIDFYGPAHPNSARQNLIGCSLARTLLSDFPTLRWTHLRSAARLKDFEDAMDSLMTCVEEGWTPKQLRRHIAQTRKTNGEKPPRIVVDNERGLKVIIKRG